MAVTAPVCPRNTEIGSPSGKRHYPKPEENGQKIELGERERYLMSRTNGNLQHE